MANNLYYFDGTGWQPISSGGGSGVGPQGPPGADGISITVYGPQPDQPANPRKGDEWIDSGVRDADNVIVEQMPTPDPEIIPIKRLPATEPEVLVIKRLPPTPDPVIVYLQ